LYPEVLHSALLSLLLVAAPASASPVQLEFRGAAGCDAAAFDRSLAAYLADSRVTRPVEAVLTVTPLADAGWSAGLEITVGGVRSSRRFAGRSCDEVAEAAAFVTAIIVDPGVLARSPGELVPMPEPGPPTLPAAPEPVAPPPAGPAPRDREPLTSPEPASPSPLTSPEPIAPPTPTPRRVGGLLRVTGGLEALGAPRVGPQVGGALGLLGRAWRVELTGMYRAPTQQVDAAGVGARVRLWSVGARGCGVLRPGPLEVPMCLGVEVGQAIADGVGFAGARRAAIPWFSPVLGSALAWSPRRWFAVWFGLDLAIVAPGERFTASGLGVVFESRPVSLRAALGLELRLL
jgi:hypothetical protein